MNFFTSGQILALSQALLLSGCSSIEGMDSPQIHEEPTAALASPWAQTFPEVENNLFHYPDIDRISRFEGLTSSDFETGFPPGPVGRCSFLSARTFFLDHPALSSFARQFQDPNDLSQAMFRDVFVSGKNPPSL